MDKKILLSGAAALLLGASVFAAPASANITFSHSGEATLTATFSDTCADQAAGLADDDGVAIAKFVGNTTYTADNAATANEVEDIIDALLGGTAVLADADADLDGNITAVDNSCAGNAETPLWATSSKLDWSAGGTLANGLSVSANQDAEIGLSGAFGSFTFAKDGDSAVKASMAAGDGDLTVAGGGFGGHALSTAGTAGDVTVLYQAPSMGGMDIYVSYAPNSDAGATLDNSKYTDTIGFGASFGLDAMTISAGYETATANTAGACDHTADVAIGTGNISAVDLADDIYGTSECGDQSLMAIGAAMSVGGVSLDAGYSTLDTDEADRDTTSINLATSAGAYDLSIGYVNSEKTSKVAGADVTQTAIAGSVSTALGDGVELGITVSNNEYDDESQSAARGGAGATNDFLAEVELKISY